ncbi:MAG: hypothetical protein CL677_09155 [Bdellovibrionaceae bacterium]|nr:hypothetical protein [Pseudobdellovibrionaceae bacterium]
MNTRNPFAKVILMTNVILSFLVIFGFLVPVQAEVLPKLVMCKNQKIRRTIHVFKNSSGECETIYTKAGIDRQVGTARNMNSCFNVIDNIRGNLEAASWNCSEVSKFIIDSPKVTTE